MRSPRWTQTQGGCGQWRTGRAESLGEGKAGHTHSSDTGTEGTEGTEHHCIPSALRLGSHPQEPGSPGSCRAAGAALCVPAEQPLHQHSQLDLHCLPAAPGAAPHAACNALRAPNLAWPRARQPILTHRATGGSGAVHTASPPSSAPQPGKQARQQGPVPAGAAGLEG